MLAQSGESNNIGQTYISCLGLFERAKIAVDDFGLASMGWDQSQKGVQSGGKESVEDFLKRMESISAGDDVGLAATSPKGSPQQKSVKSGERESLEDFLKRMESISSGYDVELASMSQNFSREFDDTLG